MGKITGLDFETSIGDDLECVLELVALSNEDYEEVYNLRNKEELYHFIGYILASGETFVVYNASFDIEIIIGLLLRLGYRFNIEGERKKDRTMELLSGSKIYKLTTHTVVNSRMITTEFIDLGNIIIGSNLKTIAENYTDLKKGEYEKAKEVDKDFKEYNLLDARITRIAYENICRELGNNFITIGSGAFSLMLEIGYPDEKDRRAKKRAFKKTYGTLTLEDDKELRQFYRGGLGWCSVRERWCGNINSWDKKSAYPCECIGKILPTWNGHHRVDGFKEPNIEFPFAFVKMMVWGEVKENYCPVLPNRNQFGDSNNYIYEGQEVDIIKIYGEKSEYDWFMENIRIDKVIYIETILMKSADYNPLEKYMVKYYNIKETSDGVKKDTAKRLINALTGKLGTNPVKYAMSYKLDSYGILERDLVKETETDTYATQVVSVITSRVRCEMYRVDSLLRDKCKFRLYATDSCKHSTEMEVLETKKEIGGWNEEYHNIEFIYVGLKTYMFDPYNKMGERNVICAGISREDKQKIAPDDFYSGSIVHSMISQRAMNGRIIYEGEKRIATTIDKPRNRKEMEEWLKQSKEKQQQRHHSNMQTKK